MASIFKIALAGLLLLTASPMSAQEQGSDSNWEGLVRVRSDKIELVYLAPEADFRAYTKVMFDPPEMAMRKDWLRDQRMNTSSLGGVATERDVVRALDRGKQEFSRRFADAFKAAGFAIVTSPGPDVMRVRSGVVDIDVYAPDVSAERSRTFTREAGAATLVVEVRDSVSNALLGRAIERRLAGDNGPLMRTSVSNQNDFGRLFRRWAAASADGLVELKNLSPVDVNGARLAR